MILFVLGKFHRGLSELELKEIEPQNDICVVDVLTKNWTLNSIFKMLGKNNQVSSL